MKSSSLFTNRGDKAILEHTTERNLPWTRSDHYAITIEGHLDRCWAEWFDGWAIAYTNTGETVLSGLVADQAALHGLLMRIRDLNLTLIAVERSAHKSEACGKSRRSEVD